MKCSAIAVVAVALAVSGCASTTALRDFSSDGCSLFPDGDLSDRHKWLDCCVRHDMAYWRGGTAGERRRADAELKQCVAARTDNAGLAESMYLGVRAGGSPLLPSWFRWGYGWGYGRGYAPLTAEQQKLADDKLATYRRRRAEPSCHAP